MNIPKKFLFIPALAAMGVTYSAIFPVNRMSAESGVPYIGYVFWFSLIATVALLAIAILRRELPSLSWAHVRSYLAIGAVAVAIPVPLLAFVAPKLPVGVLTLLLILVPLITYLLSYIARVERFRITGVIGLLFGLAGMLLVLIPDVSLPEREMVGWVLLALLAPVCFASANTLAVLLRPPAASAAAMAAGMSAGATVLLAPAMIGMGQAFVFPVEELNGNLAILIAAAITASTTCFWFILVRITGPVFFSQFNYFIVLAGFGWGILLYDEQHSIYVWLATALTFFGLAIFLRGSSLASSIPAKAEAA
jgi:drug/metabolite transporter (DMT)-like permease